MREELEQIMRKQLAYAKMPRAELLAVIDQRIAEAAELTRAAGDQQAEDIQHIVAFVKSQQDDDQVREVKAAVETAQDAADRAVGAADRAEDVLKLVGAEAPAEAPVEAPKAETKEDAKAETKEEEKVDPSAIDVTDGVSPVELAAVVDAVKKAPPKRPK